MLGLGERALLSHSELLAFEGPGPGLPLRSFERPCGGLGRRVPWPWSCFRRGRTPSDVAEARLSAFL